MANDSYISQLQDLLVAIKNVDRDNLLRVTLGEAALEGDFAPRLEEIERKFEFALQHAPDVHDNQVQSILGLFEQIKSEIEQQASGRFHKFA